MVLGSIPADAVVNGIPDAIDTGHGNGTNPMNFSYQRVPLPGLAALVDLNQAALLRRMHLERPLGADMVELNLHDAPSLSSRLAFELIGKYIGWLRDQPKQPNRPVVFLRSPNRLVLQAVNAGLAEPGRAAYVLLESDKEPIAVGDVSSADDTIIDLVRERDEIQMPELVAQLTAEHATDERITAITTLVREHRELLIPELAVQLSEGHDLEQTQRLVSAVARIDALIEKGLLLREGDLVIYPSLGRAQDVSTVAAAAAEPVGATTP